MADFGVLTTGFAPKDLDTIREEINEELRAELGNSIDLSDNSVLGRIVGIIAERYANLWELSEDVYGSFDPAKAAGAALDALASITGTVRLEATESVATLTLTGTDATVVPVASRASTASTGIDFETTVEGLLALATIWTITTAYGVGDIRSNSSNIYICTVAGTSAGAGGPSGETTGIVDGTVTWDFVGNGLAFDQVTSEATATGPLVAAARDITDIETPVAGWDSVINLSDATPGRNLETDEDFRLRRALDLAAAGNGPVDPLRSDLLGVEDVTVVRLFANTTDTTDGDGVPAHNVEAVIIGGTDQDIWDQLLASVCFGIGTHGSEIGDAFDSEGTAHEMKFSRPTETEIWVDIVLTKDPGNYPEDGDDQVKAAIEAFGLTVGIGRDVVSSQVSAQCFKVPGVLDVTLAEVGTSDPPTSEATIIIGSRGLAKYAALRITVASSDGIP